MNESHLIRQFLHRSSLSIDHSGFCMHSDIKQLLVTGGTGSFGKAFVKSALNKFTSLERIVVFSRDELKQFEMSQNPDFRDSRIRFFIGDVRDGSRIKRAMDGIDTVVHAAAMKHVTASEYNPFECIKTNIIGAQNVIDACLDSNVKKVIALSTDKASSPVNLYGATKLCSDKLFVAANYFKGDKATKFAVVRYGNVMCSRGSVVPIFHKALKNLEKVKITDTRMTRFSTTLGQGVQTVLDTLNFMMGGEVVIPKLPSYRIIDVATAMGATNESIELVGIRPGEKLHEEMIAESDLEQLFDLDRYFAILPSISNKSPIQHAKEIGATATTLTRAYRSDTNPEFLTIDDLKALTNETLDATK